MANYRQIHVKIWKDPWFLELKPDEKLLFTYLITNEQTNLAGIYEISIRVIAFETCLDQDRVEEIFKKFEDEEKVFTEGTVVWVVNMRQYHENNSDKVKQRIVSDVDNIPYCELLQKYISYYPAPIGYVYGIDTISLKEEEEEYIKSNNNRETQEASKKILLPIEAETIYQDVTKQATFPASSRADDIERIIAIHSQQGDNTTSYLSKFYTEWKNRQYSRANTGWLDWAVANDIPRRRNKQGVEFKPEEHASEVY